MIDNIKLIGLDNETLELLRNKIGKKAKKFILDNYQADKITERFISICEERKR